MMNRGYSEIPTSGISAQFAEAHGVRVTPAKLIFDQFEIKEVYSIDLNILNIAANRKTVRYYAPVGKEFRFRGKIVEDTISSGISLPATLEFRPMDYGSKRDRVIITVDGEKIEIPIECNPCRPVLEVSPIIDFGVLCCNNKMVTSNLIISNTGSKSGSFEITFDSSLPVNVNPLFGKVPPNSRQKIKVELIAKHVIPHIDSKIMVKLEGISQPVPVKLSGSIVEGCLQLLSTDEEQQMSAVRLGAAYFGTDRAVCAVLYNNSPEPTDFVVILQEGAPGQEAGNDVAGSAEGVLMKARRRYDGTAVDIMNIVSTIPNQGRLQPFQKIPFVIRFSPNWKYAPIGFQCSSEVPPRQDYALYLVVARVGTDLSASPDLDNVAKSALTHVDSRLEVPICASALAPQLELTPGPEINFGDCSVSEHFQIPLSVRNMCQELPAAVVFPKIAHFRCYPDRVRLAPGQNVTVDIRFEPRHFGSFQQQQAVEILGEVFDKSDPFLIICDVIHRQFLKLIGTSKSVTNQPKPKFVPGITPLITNEVGINADVKWADASGAGVMQNAVISNNSIRRKKKGQSRRSADAIRDSDVSDNTKIAFPNDRIRSVRSFDRSERFVSIFTRVSRYNYIDPDYAMTDVEIADVLAHKRFYKRYIDDIKALRRQVFCDKKASRYEGDPNIGLEPACGILPKKLTLVDIHREAERQKSEDAASKVTWAPLSSKQLAQMAIEASAKPPVETLVPTPMTAVQKAECSRRLTPRELHQVTIDPGSVEFGEVCVRSAVRRELSILNNLDHNVSFKLKIDCPELRQSSPIQAVVPPRSRAVIPLCFEADQMGRFQRSLEYFINDVHPGHVTVTADVVPVELHLSTSHLILTPTPGLSPEAGIRGVITLINRRNRCAEFQWHPVLQDGVIAFSIRPAVGKVEPFQDLDCEVVFHASFFAPSEAQFICHVKDGPRLNFACSARLGQASCELIEKRILFGAVPIHLVTTKKAIIYNGGPHHAYFWVEEPNPLPGLTITPNYGVVPVGGTAELLVTVQPSGQMKFDTKTLISIRDHPTLDLRIGGSSEPSSVDIDLSSFKFAGGVPLGTSATLPFTITNKCNVRSQIVFDLTHYRDFFIKAKPDRIIPEENTFNSLNPGKFMFILSANEAAQCTLVFTPTEIASYDFVIPVSVNETMCRLPLPTPLPRTPIAASRRPSSVVVEHILTPKPVPVRLTTPCRRVTVTAIRQTLKLSSTSVEFILPVGFEQKRREFMIEEKKVLTITNVGPQQLRWRMDLAGVPDTGIFKFFRNSGTPFLTLGDSGSGFIEDTLESQQSEGILIVFSPVVAGEWRYEVPIYLNEQERPCQNLNLYGCVRQPKLSFDPEALILPPVPLLTRAEAKLQILAYDYQVPTPINVETPVVEAESGEKVQPVTIVFPQGNIIRPASVDHDDGFNEPTLLTMIVLFQCDRPISFSAKLIFLDAEGRRFTLPIAATADNSLSTNYAFLAANQEGAKIVCEQGMRLKGTKSASTETINMGEAIIVRAQSGSSQFNRDDHRPGRSAGSSGGGDGFGAVGGRMRPPSTAATTPSAFDVTMSSYEPSNDSSSQLDRDGAINRNVPSVQSEGSHSKRPDTIMSRTFGSLLFPEEDSEQGMFHNDVLQAVQRWFSLFAYPIKPYPIKVPSSLRTGCGRVEGIVWGGNQRTAAGGNMSVNSAAASLKKDYQTVYQMIENLCGRPIPGMPADLPLPGNLAERVKQLHWQHTTLLTFLRSQGAAVSGIRPEFLLEPAEFRAFLEIAQRQGHPLAPALGSWGTGRTREERDIEEELFEALSKQSWMNVLLQTIKTLVLSRITPRTLKQQPRPDRSLNIPTINPDPSASNLYSVSERVLLTWLNFYYEQYRRKLWENSKRGGIPPSRWVVNFDLDLIDGLVLASVVGAFVPFLIEEYFAQMYTYPATPEQCLHNALKLMNALRAIGLEFDIQAIEITDPNPVALMLLCYELYQKLPFYLPKESVEFRGLMHSVATRQIRLVNNSDKPVIYQALLVGRNAADFHLPNGNMIAIGPKSQSTVTVSFTPRFLEPEEAVLVAVGRRQRSNTGTTMVFTLKGFVDNIKPVEVFKVETPCYEVATMEIAVKNISSQAGGKFFVRLIETHGSNPPDSALGSDLFKAIKRHQKLKKKKQDRVPKNVKAKVDHGQSTRKVKTEDLMRGVRRSSAVGSASTERSEQEEEITQVPAETSQRSLNQLLSAFYSPNQYVVLPPGGQTSLTLYFLPFSIGSYYCSIVLSNPEIGDIVYAVNATSTLPLPDDLSHLEAPGQASKALTAMAASENILEQRACQWLASPGQELRGVIKVPLVNPARERALVTAGQLRLSPTEFKRRSATNTLESATIAANALITLLGDKVSSSELNELLSSTSPVTFRVDKTDLEHFVIPDDVTIPGLPIGSKISSYQSSLDLPVTFVASSPGVYSCDILMASSTDYRLLRLSVSVTPPGQQADIVFRSSVGRIVNQLIPISNPTNFPWILRASVSGDGFGGPQRLHVPALQIANYSLAFHPTKPGESVGELNLRSDDPAVNVNFNFVLNGLGEDPPARDTIVIDCQANQIIEHTVTVTNPTPRKLTFKVSCDMDCVVGPSLLSILPGHSRPYTFSCRPLSRGIIKGALVFEARSDVLLPTYDSDGDEIPDPYAHEATEYDGFRVWFDMKLRVSPPLPVQHLDITACCLQSSVLEIAIRNPTNEQLKLSALVEGDHHLTGPSSLEIEPQQTSVYEVTYRPRRVGHSRGTVTLFSPISGEFWYDLALTSITPPPIQLPQMICQLGRWTSQTITLENPISEPISFIARLNNTLNFRLDFDATKPLVVKPRKSVDVSLTFTPSALGMGEAGQNCTLSFTCQQFGELVYNCIGGGQLPEVQEPVLLIAEVGAAATVNIPWRNPFDIAVNLEISLIDLDEEKARIYGKIHKPNTDVINKLAASGIVPTSSSTEPNRLNAQSTNSAMIVADGAFRVLSRPITGAFVSPRGAHSITVAFTPVVRRVHEATLVVKVHRSDNQPWKIPPNPSTGVGPTEMRDLQWLYPLNGLPDLGEPDWRKATVIRGTVGMPLSSRLEAALSGVATGRGHPASMNLWLEADRSENLALTEGSLTADEFSFNVLYPDPGSSAMLSRAVSLKLINQLQDRLTGLVVLRFQIDIAAESTFNHRAELLIHSTSGGMWKFPITIAADYPPPVETISLPTLSGGMESSSSIVISNTYVNDSIPFSVRFEPQDPAFSVYPETGLLGPAGSAQAGVKITVRFKPACYGRTRQSKLVARIGSSKCVVYAVEGLGPQYEPPQGSVKVDSWNQPYNSGTASSGGRTRVNYVLQNMALVATGVSSPIKGARLCKRKAKQQQQKRQMISSSLPMIGQD